MYKVSLGSFGAFTTSGDLVSRKWPVVERNGPNFGPLEYVFSEYRIIFIVSVQVQYVVIWCFSDFHRPHMLYFGNG